MTCVEAEKMVVPYMKDELSPTELEDFLDHIHTCENCREELEIHYMVDVGLKKLDEADTDWMVLPLRNAFDHKHSLFVEGGTQNLRWGVDASYNGANGCLLYASRCV